jgi:hypothetical protein
MGAKQVDDEPIPTTERSSAAPKRETDKYVGRYRKYSAD